MRARVDVEKSPGRGEKEQIVVTEIPYQVNKARVAARISELVREKKLEGIAEVRDESDRDGMRLVIELKKDVIPQVVINQLYRQTDLQTSYGVINLAISQGRPAVLNLKETLEAFIAHRRDVVTRRTRYELAPGRGPARDRRGPRRRRHRRRPRREDDPRSRPTPTPRASR